MSYRDRFWRHNDRDSTECADCGVPATEAEYFEIHHKNGRGFQDNIENLVGLCKACHQERHKNLDTVTTVDDWKAAFRNEFLAD